MPDRIEAGQAGNGPLEYERVVTSLAERLKAISA